MTVAAGRSIATEQDAAPPVSASYLRASEARAGALVKHRVHRLDAAVVYRLGFEKSAAEVRYQAVADEGIPLREIASVIGRRLKVPVVSKTPEEANEHFGGFALFAAADIPGSSQWTRERLGWQPKQPGLIPEIDGPSYLPETWIPDSANRDLRHLMRTRLAMREYQTGIKSRIIAAINAYGLRDPEEDCELFHVAAVSSSKNG
jgi:hypothetical protein